MRIGIDFHVLQEKWQGQGIHRYIQGLYQAALKIPCDHKWVFFINDTTHAPLNWPGHPEWQGFNTKSRLARLGWATHNRLKESKIDCYHIQYVAPLIKSSIEVVTIHDILFETHPQFFPSSTRFTLAPLIRRSARRASMILTVSNYSRKMLMERWGIPEEKICLTPNAVNPELFNLGDPLESKSLIKKNYDIEDYILSVGRIEPRKNHRALVQSYAYLKSLGKSLPKLVFVGGKDFGYQDLATQIHQEGLAKDVVFLHSVSDQMLPHLYRAALVMVYPSFAEGFGIPPLEAMACGCPVISSNSTALGEVVGDAGWLIDPNKWPTLAAAVWDAIQTSRDRCIFIKRGVERASTFSWEDSAMALINAYNNLS